jgi:hypothetical protein
MLWRGLYKKTVLLKLITIFLVGSLLCLPVPVKADIWLIEEENQSHADWIDFHFLIFQIPGSDSAGNVSFCDSYISNCQNPTSSQSPFTWSFSNSYKGLDIFFPSDPVGPGKTVSFEISVNNSDRVLYGISAVPTVVPEPVSSTLFAVGSATMGIIAIYRRNKKQAVN